MENKYLIGQKLTLDKDVEFKSMFADDSFSLKKGKELFVKADDDKYLTDYSGKMYAFKFEKENGYSVKGITDFIYNLLECRLPLDEILEEYEYEESDVKGIIIEALEELGFWSDKGNGEWYRW